MPAPYRLRGPLSYRNKFINGGLDLWQRGTSLAVTTGQSKYLADRWMLSLAGTSAAANYSQATFTPGQGVVPQEPSYYAVINISNGGDAVNGQVLMAQYIENVTLLAGQTVTVSFWAMAPSSTKVALEAVQNFGTGGSPSTSVSTPVGYVTVTNTWQLFTFTFNIPSISGKTLGTNGLQTSSLAIQFWISGGSALATKSSSIGIQTGVINLAQFQIETGRMATPFEIIPISLLKLLCQRYYLVMGGASITEIFGNGYWTSATNTFAVVFLSAPFRVFPTFAYSSLTHFVENGTAITAMTLGAAGEKVASLSITSSGAVAGQGSVLQANATVSARLTFDAEF